MKWPVVEELVCEVLLHKKVHFGDSFDLMLDYYSNEDHIGIIDGIGKREILDVYHMTCQDENIEEYLFEDHHLKLITDSLEQYKSIRGLLDVKDKYKDIYQLFVDLIFSETDKEIYINSILHHEHRYIVLDMSEKIIEDPLYYSSLSPGYGHVPVDIIKLVGQTKDKKWFKLLFHNLLRYGSNYDDAIISVMQFYEDDYKQWLKTKLLSKPYSKDNERSALILGTFVLNSNDLDDIYSFILDQMDKMPLMLIDYCLSLIIDLGEVKKLNLKKQLKNRISVQQFIF